MIVRVLFTLLFILASTQSVAIFDLELKQGVAAAMPIAVVPFSGVEVIAKGNQLLTEIIQNDLQNSGEFRVINEAGLVAQKSEAIDWRAKGADYALTGSISANKTMGYQIHLQLRSLFHAKEEMLLDETYTVAKGSMRTLAHQISDAIYFKLTGAKGIFSTRVAYVLVEHPTKDTTNYQLVVADVDGFNAQTLLRSKEPIMSPAWAPNGKKIAYVSFEGHRAAIYLQELSTGKREVVSHESGVNGAPAFSPDGKKLALVLTKSGNPKLYLLDLTTKQLQQLTKGWSIDTEPAFAPDGKSLAFTSNRDGAPQVYQYLLETGAITRVTFTGEYNARPSFSPDGRSLVVMHRDQDSYRIARVELESGSVSVLSQADQDESPSLAPNGKMIIYSSELEGFGVLSQVSIDGRIKLRLPAHEGALQDPAWSPFLT